MTISSQVLEKITVDAYNEFYEKHKGLFKQDPQEYWHQASEYKERVLRDYKMKNGGYKSEPERKK